MTILLSLLTNILMRRDFKVVMIGDRGVGKTALVERYTRKPFREDYAETVGSPCTPVEVNVDGERVTLQLWDTAGEERYRSFTPIYCRGAHGVVLTFDLTRKETFDNLPMWMERVHEGAGKSVSTVLVGNKSDLQDRAELETEALGHFETSAKTGQNVSLAFETLAKMLVAASEPQESGHESIVEPLDPSTVARARAPARGACC
jgi:small GTP-binding protein